LSSISIDALSGSVTRPHYDRDQRAVGIVHFGMGAFHRAHMAAYTDAAMGSEDGGWSILGVSLRSPSVREQMRPQNGLYTLVERSAAGSSARLVGSVADVLVAGDERERLVATLASPTTHIASFTITEKGYCRAADGSLDAALADDRSAYSYLAEAFARRRDACLPGLTLLSCDNLSGNGRQLQQLMRAYLDLHAPDLVGWFDAECRCPSTMVDRIVPATTEADLAEIEGVIMLRDEAAVVTEPFSQWVIEDDFAGPRPAWERHGVQITSDVHAFENAKLRMLNGAHSALAYLGLQQGHEYVHQAIDDPKLAPLVDRLIRVEAATSLRPAAGQDLDAYADALIARFRNPALNHRLAQIAMDGSQKIPQRWLDTLSFHQMASRQCPAILAALGAWLAHIRGDNGPVEDPMAQELLNIWQRAGEGMIVPALFGPGGLMAGAWVPSANDTEVILQSLS
jgi:fructuronate reductase